MAVNHKGLGQYQGEEFERSTGAVLLLMWGMKNGPYELVKAPDNYPGRTYRGARRYVYEHILIWWIHAGTLPKPNQVVHHKNGKQRDNRFRNLELKTRAAHTKEHQQREKAVFECSYCGKTSATTASDLRRRRKASDRVCCSVSCGRKMPRKNTTHDYSGYRYGCRCSVCRAANAAKARSYRARKK